MSALILTSLLPRQALLQHMQGRLTPAPEGFCVTSGCNVTKHIGHAVVSRLSIYKHLGTMTQLARSLKIVTLTVVPHCNILTLVVLC